MRASYEGFGGCHGELYRGLPALLRGGLEWDRPPGAALGAVTAIR
ncbi:hypothetical protein ACI8AC_03105 [Geodermatophilus sp. SYSU D00758]